MRPAQTATAQIAPILTTVFRVMGYMGLFKEDADLAQVIIPTAYGVGVMQLYVSDAILGLDHLQVDAIPAEIQIVCSALKIHISVVCASLVFELPQEEAV